MSYDCYCDYDPPTFYNSVKRKARKQYECDECDGPILPGETYEYVSGLWEDMFSTFRTCERCRDLCTWVTNNIPCTCWAHGNMHDDLQESVTEATWRAKDETVGVRFGFLRRKVAIEKFNAARRSTPALPSEQRSPGDAK